MKIELKNVSKKIGETTVINHVNLTMTQGMVYGFKGINGSGKTMLMRLVAGLIYPTDGEIFIDGKAMKHQNNFPESMGLLIENPVFLDAYSGFENLAFIATIKNKSGTDEIKNALQRVGLDPQDNKKFKKYSLGMKQRLGIACAIMETPELIILDEPFVALDEDGVAMLENIIQEEKGRGAIVMLSCHDADLLNDLSDTIYKLVAGKFSNT